MTNTKKMILAALCFALGLVLPSAFHMIGAGTVFLPMHIPVLICGLVCGWQYGAAVGFVYMVLGYSVYWAFHGSVSAPLVMLGEMLLGAVLGALSGAVVANLRPKKRRKAA